VKEKQEKALAGPIGAAVPVKEAPPKPENISGYRPLPERAAGGLLRISG